MSSPRSQAARVVGADYMQSHHAHASRMVLTGHKRTLEQTLPGPQKPPVWAASVTLTMGCATERACQPLTEEFSHAASRYPACPTGAMPQIKNCNTGHVDAGAGQMSPCLMMRTCGVMCATSGLTWRMTRSWVRGREAAGAEGRGLPGAWAPRSATVLSHTTMLLRR